MKAFVYYNSYAHCSPYERYEHKKIIRKKLFKANDKEALFHKIYKSNCQETYCYPRSCYRFVNQKLAKEFKEWEDKGGINLYAKYNRMD